MSLFTWYYICYKHNMIQVAVSMQCLNLDFLQTKQLFCKNLLLEILVSQRVLLFWNSDIMKCKIFDFWRSSDRRTSAPVQLTSTTDMANPLNMSESIPYNSTMQCYCGQNSCPFCNLLLNLERTETGLEW